MKRIQTAMMCVLAFCSTAMGFDIRGMHVDLRAEVMTMDALKCLADKAAKGGINTIIMEWEATFPFDRNATLCNDEAYSADEVRDFIAYCTRLGIDVIPLQNCFGHCEYILRHPRYVSICEDQSRQDLSQVCPCKIDEAKEIFRSIFADITDIHTSKYIHIGGDETRLLGLCPQCAEKVAAEGKPKLFCDYVKAMCEVASEFGKTPIIWADILTKFSEAAGDLPKNLVVLDWNYGWDFNRFGDLRKLIEKGFTMWSAPSLRSHPDDIYATQWMKHFNNLSNYVHETSKLGFQGVVETSWSTSGVYTYLFDRGGAVVDMQSIRQVYPLCGFDILQQAFCTAANSGKRFNPEEFIRSYCATTFGLDKAGVDVMWAYFNMPQRDFFGEAGSKDLPTELDNTIAMRKKLSDLHPKKGRTEFAHLALMLDIRINFLQFLAVKYRYESKDFTAVSRAGLKQQMGIVKRDLNSLQKRFCKLCKNYLKHPERAFGSWGYAGQAEKLYQILSNE